MGLTPCLDLREVEVVAQDGTIQRNPVAIVPMIASLVSEEEMLLVSEEEVWSGENFCS